MANYLLPQLCSSGRVRPILDQLVSRSLPWAVLDHGTWGANRLIIDFRFNWTLPEIHWQLDSNQNISPRDWQKLCQEAK